LFVKHVSKYDGNRAPILAGEELEPLSGRHGADETPEARSGDELFKSQYLWTGTLWRDALCTAQTASAGPSHVSFLLIEN